MLRRELWSATFVVAFNVISIGLLLDRGIFFTDFDGQWRLCAYALRGIDPYPLIGLEPPVLDELGAIPIGWGTSPWGLLLGNFFYPGFLSIDAARTFFLASNFIVLVATVRAFYLRTDCNPWTLILFGCPASFLLSTCTGNAGAMICSLLLLSCLTCEHQPICAAILLSLAMVKPQIALAFCLIFLIQRRFRVLLTAAAIDLGAWLIVARLIERTPLDLLREFSRANIGGGSQFSGVFTLLLDTPMQSLALSMIFGAAFIWFLRSEGFIAPCLASAFWSYSYFNEFYLLTLPALACLRSKKKLLGVALHVGITFWTAVAFWHRRQLELGLISDGGLLAELFRLESWLEVRTFFCLIFIAAGVVLRHTPMRSPSTKAA